MRWPAGIVARPLAKSDVDALAVLLAAAEAVDHHGTSFDADHLIEELDTPYLDLALDTLGLWDGGRMVGCAKVWSRPGVVDVDRVWIDGRIHPSWRRRGLGRLLLEWGCARARVAHAERHPGVPGKFQGRCNATNESASALFTGAGFALARCYFGMERQLSLEIPPAPVPEGLRVVTFDPAYDEATRMAHNEAFRDHWGSRERTEQDWRASVTGSRTFRGPMSQLALDGDQVVAYVLGYDHGEGELHVGFVGTRRSHRGRGLANALVSRVLTAAAVDGYAVATLGVDAENATGALGLYERIGFVARRKTANYSLEM
ncbi:GNAT family N-acetyltransferase [Tenggerimyces flavus]|uniref:GNAT family N-acetyltransferase n=1 Tax=Tenggerimyces flavus TaxID=1708749 RepID=A0ABV7Y9I0_9ACTN|nr:GNAT family N-acetyltransferase [Tenggerimyces flavus]MBM7783535.1 ribosomal protein S18 acetylase RimI-like enzyme [Tenggerimyces flavus]